jgi:hypothetical protein
VDKAHFDIDENGVRIRSIDVNDFCYVDLLLKPPFFDSFGIDHPCGFGIDVSKFARFLPSLASASEMSITFNEDHMVFEAMRKWRMEFRVNFLEDDPYDLPEPKGFRYQAFAEIPSKEFSKLVNTASTISNELNFSISGKKLLVSANSGDYSFLGEPSNETKVENKDNLNISASAIAGYIKTLGELINNCDNVRIMLGNDKPVRLDLKYQEKGTFSFTLSYKRASPRPLKESGRNGTSLPRLTVTKLPEFLLYLSNCPNGEETRFLRGAGFETSGGDYCRMTQQLGLAERFEGKIRLSKNGEIFVNLTLKDQEQAKTFLNGVALSRILSYKVMIGCLQEKAMTPEELYEEINKRPNKMAGHAIDKQDLSTLLGLAIWCGVLDRKLALYYLKRARPN